MRLILLLFFILFIDYRVNSQSSFEVQLDTIDNYLTSRKLDDARLLLEKLDSSSSRSNLLWADLLFYENRPSEGYKFIEKEFTRNFTKERKSRFCFNKASLSLNANKYDEALAYLDSASLYMPDYNGSITDCNIMTLRGNAFFYKGELGQCAIHFSEAVNCFEASNLFDEALPTKINLASIYIENRNFNKAIVLFKEAINYIKQKESSKYLDYLYLNLSVAYQNVDFDSALYYIRKAEPIVKGNLKWSFNNSMANLLIKREEYDQVRPYLEASLAIAEENSMSEELKYSESTRCYYLYKTKQVDAALSCYDNLKDYFAQTPSRIAKRDFLKYHVIAKYFKNSGDSDLEDYFALEDSIQNDNIKLEIDNAIEEYKTRLVRDSLRFSNFLKETAENESNRKTKYISLIALLSIAFMLGAAYFIRSLMRKNQQIQTLNKEMHHRVKNNLAFMTSLLEMQERRVEDPSAKAALQDSESRIRTLALLHNQLFKNESSTNIALKAYLNETVKYLNSYFKLPNKELNITSQIEDIMLNSDDAMRLGLIINEMITNSVKHAFSDVVHPHINIKVLMQDNKVAVHYSDNGPGIDQHKLSLIDEKHLGTKLIELLKKQLGEGYIFV